MATTDRPYLVFSSVGPESQHPAWLEGRRNFDVALVDYHGGLPHDPQVRLWKRPGTKWPNLAYALREWPDLASYRVIAVLDDDLQLSGHDLERAFHLFEEHNLWLAQPSLRWGSAYSWPFTLQRPYLTLRYCAFVENGLTLLRGHHLAPLTSLFEEARSGFGVCWAIPQLLRTPPLTVAVLDEVSCYHPPRQSALDRCWERAQHVLQGDELCRRFGVQPLEPREYGFELNARGQAWVAEGATPKAVYSAAQRFLLNLLKPRP